MTFPREAFHSPFSFMYMPFSLHTFYAQLLYYSRTRVVLAA